MKNNIYRKAKKILRKDLKSHEPIYFRQVFRFEIFAAIIFPQLADVRVTRHFSDDCHDGVDLSLCRAFGREGGCCHALRRIEVLRKRQGKSVECFEANGCEIALLADDFAAELTGEDVRNNA